MEDKWYRFKEFEEKYGITRENGKVQGPSVQSEILGTMTFFTWQKYDYSVMKQGNDILCTQSSYVIRDEEDEEEEENKKKGNGKKSKKEKEAVEEELPKRDLPKEFLDALDYFEVNEFLYSPWCAWDEKEIRVMKYFCDNGWYIDGVEEYWYDKNNKKEERRTRCGIKFVRHNYRIGI